MKNLPDTTPQEQRVAAAIHFHEMASASAAQMAVSAAKCGLELKALKKEVGSGAWEITFEKLFSKTSLKLRTAQKYMALAEGLKGKALKNAPGAFLELLDTAPSKLSQDEQKKLTNGVAKMTDGATLSELYQDFGIAKKPQGSGAKGGKIAKKEDGTDETKEMTTAEVMAEGKRTTVKTLVTMLTEALEDQPWNACDKADRETLHGLLVDAAAAVAQTVKK